MTVTEKERERDLGKENQKTEPLNMKISKL